MWYTFSSNVSQSIGSHSSASELPTLHNGVFTTNTPHPTNHYYTLHGLDQCVGKTDSFKFLSKPQKYSNIIHIYSIT